MFFFVFLKKKKKKSVFPVIKKRPDGAWVSMLGTFSNRQITSTDEI